MARRTGTLQPRPGDLVQVRIDGHGLVYAKVTGQEQGFELPILPLEHRLVPDRRVHTRDVVDHWRRARRPRR